MGGMKYLGAYLMAVIGGKESPTEDDIKAILEAGGITCDDALLAEVCKRMDGKSVHELIAEGSTKFAACGGGGGCGTVFDTTMYSKYLAAWASANRLLAGGLKSP